MPSLTQGTAVKHFFAKGETLGNKGAKQSFLLLFLHVFPFCVLCVYSSFSTFLVSLSRMVNVQLFLLGCYKYFPVCLFVCFCYSIEKEVSNCSIPRYRSVSERSKPIESLFTGWVRGQMCLLNMASICSMLNSEIRAKLNKGPVTLVFN